MTCSCKNRCEEQVAKLNTMLVRSQAGLKTLPFISFFIGFLGVVFLFWGIVSHFDLFLLSMGAVFLLWSIVSFMLQRRRK